MRRALRAFTASPYPVTRPWAEVAARAFATLVALVLLAAVVVVLAPPSPPPPRPTPARSYPLQLQPATP